MIPNIDLNYIHGLTKELSLMGNDNSEYGFRISGSSGEWRAAKRIEQEMKSIGLKNVSVEPFPVHSWEFTSGKLVANGIAMPMSSYAGAKGTPEEGLTGELIDVGRGTAADYEGLDVTGKIVLCTFDIQKDFWISLPAYQAELHGAKGCIISYSGDSYGTKKDALNSFDFQGHYGLPIGNISRENASLLRKMLKESSVIASMMLTVTIDFNGTSSNVVGYIPGEDSHRMILLGGHMDGYFHSYQDDLLGVGIILGIAKFLIENGYQPKHTLAFIAHGSEEYGTTNSRYDWCIGSWNSVNRIHPDWFGKITAFLNIDAIRPGTPIYNITSTPEYHCFFKDFMKTMNVPKTSWPGGSALLGLNGPWSDDYNYAIKGIPCVICGRGPAEWSYQNYHTQFDNYTIYDEEKEIIEYVATNYIEILYAFDCCVLPPLNYKDALQDLLKDLKPFTETSFQDQCASLETEKNRAIQFSEQIFDKISELNSLYKNDSVYLPHTAAQVRAKLLEAYRLIQGDLMKLSPDDDVIYPHKAVASNILAIKEAISAFTNNNFAEAVGILWNFDLFKIAYQFDPQVYNWLMECQDCTRSDLYWGTGKLHKFANLLPLVDAISKKDTQRILSELKHLLNFEYHLLKDILEQELVILKQLNAILASVDI